MREDERKMCVLVIKNNAHAKTDIAKIKVPEKKEEKRDWKIKS